MTSTAIKITKIYEIDCNSKRITYNIHTSTQDNYSPKRMFYRMSIMITGKLDIKRKEDYTVRTRALGLGKYNVKFWLLFILHFNRPIKVYSDRYLYVLVFLFR